MFAAGGFDADRDIAGITLYRQGHAYPVTPPGFFFGKDGSQPPADILREPRTDVFAHAELKGYQMWKRAVHEADTRCGSGTSALVTAIPIRDDDVAPGRVVQPEEISSSSLSG